MSGRSGAPGASRQRRLPVGGGQRPAGRQSESDPPHAARRLENHEDTESDGFITGTRFSITQGHKRLTEAQRAEHERVKGQGSRVKGQRSGVKVKLYLWYCNSLSPGEGSSVVQLLPLTPPLPPHAGSTAAVSSLCHTVAHFILKPLQTFFSLPPLLRLDLLGERRQSLEETVAPTATTAWFRSASTLLAPRGAGCSWPRLPEAWPRLPEAWPRLPEAWPRLPEAWPGQLVARRRPLILKTGSPVSLQKDVFLLERGDAAAPGENRKAAHLDRLAQLGESGFEGLHGDGVRAGDVAVALVRGGGDAVHLAVGQH
ncbi:hypothetical protein EYF80_057977 [Liparis tanakae]|uniref:Uncharacterized protein n=1 Tax=Liparis tanakae TaxID=230148 RepID=A0A4Z2ESH4_9TELE|nr:hypothetical protein EYF80_057977 [Liparis tanakae]